MWDLSESEYSEPSEVILANLKMKQKNLVNKLVSVHLGLKTVEKTSSLLARSRKTCSV